MVTRCGRSTSRPGERRSTVLTEGLVGHELGRNAGVLRDFLGHSESRPWIMFASDSISTLGAMRSTSPRGLAVTGRIPVNVATRTSCTLVVVSGLPETDVARVHRWCRDRVPEHVRDEVRIEVDVAERHLTIVECRAPWRADMGAEWTRFPIARLRYTKATGVWSLYWRDRNLRFHAYDLVSSTASIEDLLAEVDRDPTAIFWG
jgi:hypothetical protein